MNRRISKRATLEYGWWLSPDGALYMVNFGGHEKFVVEHPEIFGPCTTQHPYKLAHRKNWIRITRIDNFLSFVVPNMNDSSLHNIQSVLEKLPKVEKIELVFMGNGLKQIDVNYKDIFMESSVDKLLNRIPIAPSISVQDAKDPLSKYKEKREFDETAEPEGKTEKGKNKHRFVIQKHDAEKAGTHYDLRLENDDGAMSSWTVPKARLPKGKEKLLAQQTEDHPISYNKFEGKIEEGYGKGTVKIHDKGNYELIKWTKDTIKFKLKGKKEKGTYTLHRTDGKKWLLMVGGE
jgi:DNA ligase D-like protein (predicted 3'-phosphoesterase)